MRGTIITTRRLRLRTWRMCDAADYHAHINTEPVMAYLGGVMGKREVGRELEWLRRQQTRDGHTFWAVERNHSTFSTQASLRKELIEEYGVGLSDKTMTPAVRQIWIKYCKD